MTFRKTQLIFQNITKATYIIYIYIFFLNEGTFWDWMPVSFELNFCLFKCFAFFMLRIVFFLEQSLSMYKRLFYNKFWEYFKNVCVYSIVIELWMFLSKINAEFYNCNWNFPRKLFLHQITYGLGCKLFCAIRCVFYDILANQFCHKSRIYRCKILQ